MSSRQDTAWETGWDGHEAQQLQRLAGLTLADKLEWLEESQRLLRHLSAARQRPVGGKDSVLEVSGEEATGLRHQTRRK